MKCIEGMEDCGVYAPKKGAKIEDWDAVQATAQHVEEMESLEGVGWSMAYCVTIDHATRIYLVGKG